jgi:DNA-directed RNA polymerase specialized sigma24 family protein
MLTDGSPGTPSRRRWTLTPHAFDLLLAALDSDRDRAAVAYEQLRHRLIGLLQWWGAPHAEDLADETLDRVARKLEHGAAIDAGSFGAYVRGVARMVYYEWTREPRNHSNGRDQAVPLQPDDVERASQCLDRCLASLDPADSRLLLRYYAAGKSADIRKQLADDVAISITALRIRMHRLRGQIVRCVTDCVDRSAR